MILIGGAIALTRMWIEFRRRVLSLPPRNGASWETMLKRMRYRGGRKQRSATRRVLRAVKRYGMKIQASSTYGKLVKSP